MTSISIRQLAVAMCRKNFAELVSYQIKKRSFADLEAAIDETKRCLSPEIQLEIDEIIKSSETITADRDLWSTDCGKALRLFTSMTEKHMADRFIRVTEKELIEIFHIIVMHTAWLVGKEPRQINLLRERVLRSRARNIYPRQHPCPA